jgi:hypothetical protein
MDQLIDDMYWTGRSEGKVDNKYAVNDLHAILFVEPLKK